VIDVPIRLASPEIDHEVLHMFALVAEGITSATAAFVGGDIEAAR
jgi:hypothetical protein